MKRIFILILFIKVFYYSNAQITIDTNNIYYFAIKEYLNKCNLKSFDTVIILNKHSLSLPNNLKNIKIISVSNDKDIIQYYSDKISFEIFPKKWKLFYSEVSILNFFVENSKLTIYGNEFLHLRRKLFSKQYCLIKNKKYTV